MPNASKRRPLLYEAGITLAAILAGLFMYATPLDFLGRLELETVDMRFRWRGEIEPGPEVVLAVIDEKSIAQEGKWIWPRRKIADMVTRLSNAGARVVGFDIGFLEPDTTDRAVADALDAVTSRLEPLREIAPDDAERLAAELESLKTGASQDQALADAVATSQATVILGYFFHTGEVQDAVGGYDEFSGTRYDFVRMAPGMKDFPVLEATAPEPNIPLISRAAKYAGHFNIQPDEDGVVRRLPLVIQYRNGGYAPLSLLAAAVFRNSPLGISVGTEGVRHVTIGDTRIPTDESGDLLINYRGPENTFPQISVTDILRQPGPEYEGRHHDRPATIDIRNKIVLVGATAIGIYDLRVMPFDEIFPGLEIHANVVDNILRGDFLRQPRWLFLVDLLLLLFAGLFLGLALPRFQILAGTFVTLGLMVAHVGFVHLLFARWGLLLNMSAPFLVILIMYMGITLHRFLVESRQKRFIRDAFSHYLAPSVVRQLIESPEQLVLGGERRHISAFFSDVQGFTGISEHLTPEALVELLNEFLTEMTDILLRYEGTVDKFEGDAIIAFFGAPTTVEHHERIACLACIDMQRRLVELREKWGREGRPQLKMRIGLNSGEAVVGNMGSKNRMDYTMMGDTVNTAARLEGLNKLYGTYTLIGEATAKAVPTDIVVREVDLISVVGRMKSVRVYEIMGKAGQVSETILEAASAYAAGLECYRNRDWATATAHFERALASAPEDGPSQTMLRRCREFQTAPPPENWGGVYTAREK